MYHRPLIGEKLAKGTDSVAHHAPKQKDYHAAFAALSSSMGYPGSFISIPVLPKKKKTKDSKVNAATPLAP